MGSAREVAAPPGVDRPRAVDSAHGAGGERDRRGLLILLVALPLLAFYLLCSLGWSGGVDVARNKSSILDLDVGRVVTDWTGPTSSMRIDVHPLYKLVVAPFGITLLRALDGEAVGRRNPRGPEALRVARILAACFMTATVLAAAWLTWQLAGGALAPALLAALVCGVSFSSLLLGTIPDSAALSGLGTLVPLVYGNRRRGRPFDWGEAVAWSAIGVFSMAITISQAVPWLIAFCVRIGVDQEGLRAAGTFVRSASRVAGRLLVVLTLFALLVWSALALQRQVFPGAEVSAKRLGLERMFLQVDTLRAEPVAHVGRVALHFAGYDFAAVFPSYSDFLMKHPLLRKTYWSMTIAEVGVEGWRPAQVPLFAALLGFWVAGLWSLRRADRRFLAPCLVIAAQFGLHLIYGKETVIYSPNWHGVVVAVLVAGLWIAFASQRRILSVALACLALAMLANNLTVYARINQEVAAGMEASRRDASGHLLGEATVAPPGAL